MELALPVALTFSTFYSSRRNKRPPVKEKQENKAVASRVIIETGKTQGDQIEVLSGLENGAELIEEGARSVKDGQTVKIISY